MTRITKYGITNDDLPKWFYEKETLRKSESLYGLYDFSTGGNWMLMHTHDFNGKPLMTLEQAQKMIEEIGSSSMGIETINK